MQGDTGRSFNGNIYVYVDVEVVIIVDSSLGCFQRGSESVQVLFCDIVAVMVLTLRYHRPSNYYILHAIIYAIYYILYTTYYLLYKYIYIYREREYVLTLIILKYRAWGWGGGLGPFFSGLQGSRGWAPEGLYCTGIQS